MFTATNTAQAATTGHVVINVDSGRPVTTLLRNAATSTGPACSPGSLASMEGRWLGSDRNGVSDPSGSAMSLNGVAVKINEEYAPVVFAAWNKVTFVCPAAEPGKSLNFVVETEAGASEPLTGSNAAIAPGLFMVDDGAGQGLALPLGHVTVGDEPGLPGAGTTGAAGRLDHASGHWIWRGILADRYDWRSGRAG